MVSHKPNVGFQTSSTAYLKAIGILEDHPFHSSVEHELPKCYISSYIQFGISTFRKCQSPNNRKHWNSENRKCWNSNNANHLSFENKKYNCCNSYFFCCQISNVFHCWSSNIFCSQNSNVFCCW